LFRNFGLQHFFVITQAIDKCSLKATTGYGFLWLTNASFCYALRSQPNSDFHGSIHHPPTNYRNVAAVSCFNRKSVLL